VLRLVIFPRVVMDANCFVAFVVLAMSFGVLANFTSDNVRSAKHIQFRVHGEAMATCRDDDDEDSKKHTSSATLKSVYIYVQIDKAGSSSMRVVMDKRAILQGRSSYALPRNPGHPTPSFCKLVNSSTSLIAPCLYENALAQGKLGLCCLFAGLRHCRYIVILREPLSRIRSAWSYFCQDCKDRHKYCGLYFNPYSCPHLGLLQFASKYDNLYTRKFAKRDHFRNDLLDGGDYYHDLSDAGFTRNVSAGDFTLALNNLQSESFLVLALEDANLSRRLAYIIGDDLGFAQIMPRVNTHQHDLGARMMAHLNQSQMYDLRLYQSLFGNS